MDLYVGLMSGTSMDGIDAALVRQPTNALICGITKAYSDEVKERLDKLLMDNCPTLTSLCQLNVLIGREFAGAVHALLQTAQVSPKEIKAIGSHGQTICHEPRSNIPYTLQLGCAHTISFLTDIQVVADFRTKDIVNGGQGAPFAPIYHQELFADTHENLAIVNVGGIANLTLLSPNQPPQGWDTGPGNCLMDAWIKKHCGQPYDNNGAWGNEGQVIHALLEELLKDPFFALAAPKSIGKEYFSLAWLEKHMKQYKPVDVQATLLLLTAKTIAASLMNNPITKTLYLCGGGTHNQALMQALTALLPDFEINSIENAGISADYLEAMMFSWFAFKTLNESPIDLSPITGSKGPAILGAIYQ